MTVSDITKLPEVLTLAEVASVFRVTPVTIHRWLKKSREGESRFPQPLGTKYQHLRWSNHKMATATSAR